MFFQKQEHKVRGEENLSYFTQRWEMDCSKYLLRNISLTYYDSKGAVILSGDVPVPDSHPDSQFREIEPDSVDDVLGKILCKKGEGGK